MSSATPIQPASEPPPPLVPREWRLRLDPLLLLAALGLVACSIVTLKGATRMTTSRASRTTTSTARSSTPRVGLVLMYVVSRLDYSRLRELRVRRLRRHDRLDRCSCFGLATATRGAKRWIETAVLHPAAVRARQAAARRGARGLPRRPHAAAGGRETTARVMLLGLIPTMLVMAAARPRLGLVYVRRHPRAAVRRRGAVAALRRARGARAVAIALTLVAAARGRRQRAQDLPGGPPDVVPAPVRRAGRGGLPAAAVQDRHRLGREDRAAAWRTRRRPSWTSCPSTTPTSSSRSSARPTGSSAPRSSCPCTRC